MASRCVSHSRCGNEVLFMRGASSRCVSKQRLRSTLAMYFPRRGFFEQGLIFLRAAIHLSKNIKKTCIWVGDAPYLFDERFGVDSRYAPCRWAACGRIQPLTQIGRGLTGLWEKPNTHIPSERAPGFGYGVGEGRGGGGGDE